MAQSWKHLLFAHWPVPVETLRPSVPDALPIDTFAGQAWAAVTPFQVHALRLHGTPPVPYISSFLETNVRTYVTLEGKPGIYFFSLDAASSLAVAAARLLYRLPYFHAAMRIAEDGGGVAYTSERTDPDGAPARFAARYRPVGPAAAAAPETIDAWLVERYRLYTVGPRGGLYAADIHHRPWPLQPVSAEIRVNTMTEPIGIELDEPALLHFARRQDVVFWPLDAVPGGLSAAAAA